MKISSSGTNTSSDQDQRLLAAVARVALVDAAALERARVARLAPDHVGEAGVVDRDRAHDRVVAVARAEAHGRHDDQPVRVEAAGLMRLGPADDHAAGAPLDHPAEQVGVVLVGRALAAVALGVGHRPADHEVLRLHGLDERQQARVVAGAVLPVDRPGRGVQRVDRVHADAALEAGAGELAEAPLHAVLHDDVLHALRDVQEAVDALTRRADDGGGERGVLGGEVVGAGDRVDRRADDRVIDGLRDLLAHVEDPQAARAQALDVLGAAGDRRAGTQPRGDGRRGRGERGAHGPRG
jgi:hypothetical protein